MTVGDMTEFRRRLGLTQPQMARALGLGTRSYQDLEGQEAGDELSARHVMLVERASLRFAIERQDLNLAMPVLRGEMMLYMRLLEGRPIERIFDQR